MVNVNAVSLGPDHAEQAAWAHRFWSRLRPLSTGVSMNFLEDEGHNQNIRPR